MARRSKSKDSSPPRTCAERKEQKPRKARQRKEAEDARRSNQGGDTSVVNAASAAGTKKVKEIRNGHRKSRTPRKSRRADIHPLDRAITELRNELARSPDNALLYGRLGALQYRRGDLEEARISYRKAIELQPARAAFQNNLGNILCDLGQMKEGIACYEAAIGLEKAASPSKEISEESKVNLELARLEYRLIHERIEYLERALRLDVVSAETLNALGGGYLLCHQREKALAMFRRAAELEPRNVNAARNIAFTHVIELAGPFDLSSAMAEVAECTVRFPKEARLFIHEGELFEAAGLLESAEEKYGRALKADPRNLEAYDLLGRLREALGMTGVDDDIARLVAKSLKILSGDSKGKGGQKASDRKVSNKGGTDEWELRVDKAFSEMARVRFEGGALAGLKDVEAALSAVLSELRTQPVSEKEVVVRAGLLLAQLMEADGRRSDAARLLERLCEELPQQARLWFERAGLAYRSGEIALAVDAFERATLADPQEGYAYQSLRFAFEGYRRYRTERVRFEAAAQSGPGNALAHHHLGMAALSVLKDDEALFHFKRALELDPHLAEAACGCARALQRQGHWSESEKEFRRALQIDPGCSEARTAVKQLENRKEMKKNFQDSTTSGRSK